MRLSSWPAKASKGQLNKPWLTKGILKSVKKKKTENVAYKFLKQGLTKNRGI